MAPSRRAFPGLVAATAAATAGCSKQPSGEGTAQNLGKLDAVLPAHRDLATGIKPDIISTRPVPDGFTRYPTSLVDAIAEKPGTGGRPVTAMTPVWGPAPPGGGRSAYLQAVNAELGTPVEFTVQDGNTYADKLNAMFGARDVPELFCVTGWEIERIPRFAEAAGVLFTDLTGHLRGEAAGAYPMLAAFPTAAWRNAVWRNAVWNERLFAVPNPNDTPYPYALFARKDLLDGRGIAMPDSLDALLTVAKEVTDPARGVWAFSDLFAMVQMYHRVPGAKGGWRLRADGTPEFKYETAEYRQALEVMTKIFRAGLVSRQAQKVSRA